MSPKRGKDRSVSQRVGNRGRERRLSRDDALTAYAMDRLLCRLGKSPQASEFFLKGGVLVAHLVAAPHRFTRDIDVLRRHGPADPEDIRQRFREVAAVRLDDGVDFDPDGVRAVVADHDEDGYDGVKVFLRARVAGHAFDVRVDIGFGDALEPPAARIQLEPFLADDEPARLLAYEPGPVLAEKIETILSKFPVIQHRLKDLLDVVAISATLDFDGEQLVASLRATLDRRGTRADPRVLDDMRSELTGRRWQVDWATMLREKAVAQPVELPEAIARFDAFVRPLLGAVGGGAAPGSWVRGGPWR
jgi:hypothetical protein